MGFKKKIENRIIKLTKRLSRKGLYEFLEKKFSTIDPNSNVLIIGSNYGDKIYTLLEKFSKKLNFNVTSFDIDKKKNPDILGDICVFDFRDQQFDCVIMSEVLEHIHSPHVALKNIHTILKNGGKLIITTPFILPIHDSPYDYYRYTRYGLEYLLKEFRGLEIVERNSYFETIDVLWVRLWQTNLKKAQRLCLLVVPIVYFLKQPISLILSKIIGDIDAATTGYNVSCRK